MKPVTKKPKKWKSFILKYYIWLQMSELSGTLNILFIYIETE